MNNRGNTGIVAVILAALVGMTYLPRGSRENQAEPTQSAETQAERSPSPSEPATPPCVAIGSLLQRFFPDGVPYPDQCYPPGTTRKAGSSETRAPSLKFVIALIPNPVQTHLPLFFDRAVEAIQQAVQDEGYTYDTSWFPWSDERRTYTHIADDTEYRERKRQTELQPGVMVFRRGLGQPGGPVNPVKAVEPYSEGLVVFIVGEQPTQGVYDSQFEKSMNWIHSLAPSDKEPIRILGPSTSGALPSLERELKKTIDLWPGRKGLKIFSGTVSSSASFEWFCTSFQGIAKVDQPCVGNWNGLEFEFRTYNESDQLKTDRFCRYLVQEGYDLTKLAILSEDETAFGRDPTTPRVSEGQSKQPQNDGNCTTTTKDGTIAPIYLYYPRDIGSLRAAYERQSIFSAGKQAAGAPSTTLRGDLTEPPSSKYDTVRTYGGQLDSLALESLLQAIAVQLDRHQVQFVLIRSSNTLDQIFLGEFLRRAYPDARIVLDGADLLFLRSGQGISPRGIMALSTYPLLPGQQIWTRTLHAPHNGSYRVFGQDSAEAVYLATRGLIASDSKDSKDPSQVPVHDSLPPWWAPAQNDPNTSNHDFECPSTWLTVIGHGRFWPLAALSEATEMKSGEKSLLTPASKNEFDSGNNPGPDDKMPGAHLVFPLQMTVLLVVCILLAFWQLYCCWYGSIRGRLRALTYFAPLPQPEQRGLIFLSSLLIGLMGAVVAVLSGLSSSAERAVVTVFSGLSSNAERAVVAILSGLSSNAELNYRWKLLMWGTAAIMLLCSVLSLVGNYSLPRVRGRPESANNDIESGTLFGGLAKRLHHWSRLILWSTGLLLLLVLGYAVFLHFYLIHGLTSANRFPTFWRAIHLFSGVSPLLPQVLLLLGLRAWLWCNLHGMALLGDDRPRLPKEAQIPLLPLEPAATATGKPNMSIMRIFSREHAQKPVEDQAMPLGPARFRMLVICFPVSALVFSVALQGWSVRSLGEMHFGRLVFWWLVLVTAMLVADTIQMLRTWRRLHRLLLLLDRLRVRRTLAAMKGIAWGSVWKMSGNVLDERYRVISRQFESLGNLRNVLQEWVCKTPERDEARAATLKRVETCERKGLEFANWYVKLSDPERDRSLCQQWKAAPAGFKNKYCAVAKWLWQFVDRKLISDVGPMDRFQLELANTAGVVLSRVLVPEWQKESESLLIDKSRLQSRGAPETDPRHPFASCTEVSELIRTAEEFFILPYLGFIQNTLGCIRTMVGGMLALFVGMTLAVASYPFDPLPVLAGIFLGLFILEACVVAWVYAGMNRDATLSYITNTNPGELGWQFWARMAAFGIGPLLALMTTWFPSMSDFLVSWLQPAAQTMK